MFEFNKKKHSICYWYVYKSIDMRRKWGIKLNATSNKCAIPKEKKWFKNAERKYDSECCSNESSSFVCVYFFMLVIFRYCSSGNEWENELDG